MTKLKCLLIEEDKMLASLIGFRLKKLQFEVHYLAASKTQDISDIGAQTVIVGLHSTSPNIINFLSVIRAGIGENIPLIVIVSNERQKRLIENHRIKVDTYLPSPVNLSDLENATTRLIKVKNTEIQEGFRKTS